MSNHTCAKEDCESQRLARGLCGRHYQAARSSGTLPPLQAPQRHSLSEVDIENATAVCAICGPVGIRVRRDGKTHECRTLRRAGWARYHKKNPGKRSSPTPESRLRQKYGLKMGEYAAMQEMQGGLCAICKKKPKGKLVVDHNHQTGAVRQLLCGHCNVAIGFLRESAEAAVAAAEYIRKHSV